jgi:hypothetical protein
MPTPVFEIERTSQRGQSLLQWYDEGSRKIGALHSLQMPTEVAEYIVSLQKNAQAANNLNTK